MVTYFLSENDVVAYLRDFFERYGRLDPIPTVWCPVTLSGVSLMKKMLPLVEEFHPNLAETITLAPVQVESGKSVHFEGTSEDDIRGKSVLLFDSSMHTGDTMRSCVKEAKKLGASAITTYSLVIKRGSSLVPTFWGVMIDDTDRIYFLLDRIPNGRLNAEPAADMAGNNKKISSVHLERLCEDHINREPITCGLKCLDRVSWGDRHFDMQAGENGACTYVLVNGSETIGYMSLHFANPISLFITEIAIDQRFEGRGYGGILMRFADTLARQSNCTWVRLNAVEDKVSFYEKFDYRLISGRAPISLDDKKYYPMEHKVVYNWLKPA
jgi:GNAT superfamily N-acetyltransferase